MLIIICYKVSAVNFKRVIPLYSILKLQGNSERKKVDVLGLSRGMEECLHCPLTYPNQRMTDNNSLLIDFDMQWSISI